MFYSNIFWIFLNKWPNSIQIISPTFKINSCLKALMDKMISPEGLFSSTSGAFKHNTADHYSSNRP